MQLIFDNITSTFIATAVIFLLMATNHQAQLTSVETTANYVLHSRVNDFMAVFMRDMRNVTTVVTPVETDSVFAIRARTDGLGSPERLVEYRRARTGSVSVNSGTVDQFKIVRSVDGVVTSESVSTVSNWTIQGQDNSGNIATTASDVTSIFVDIEASSPISIPGVSERDQPVAQWQSVFKPRLLREAVI
ncbi:MAG: hypothetical protein HKN43_08510 [Rhodothermales bacterium]|nr:hypothetical protein [Rhodothermales bacterium]